MNPNTVVTVYFFMKVWGYGLYIGLFAIGVGASGFVRGPSTEVVIADRELSSKSLLEVAQQIGVTRGFDLDGFLTLRARGSFESAERRLRGLGVDFVFPLSAKDVNTNSLTSVSDHIRFLKTKKLLNDPSESDPEVGFYEALKFYLERRVEGDGQLDEDRWIRGAAHREQMPRWRPRGKAALGPNGPFEHLGPFGLDTPYRTYYGVPPLSGRKTGMAYAPPNASIVYAVGGGSGLWRSEDGGATWVPKSDNWATVSRSIQSIRTLFTLGRAITRWLPMPLVS
jgi:hypothetical protein